MAQPPTSRRPSEHRPASGQRAVDLVGGSLTTRTPCSASSGAAHSAVDPGGAKPLAVTNEAIPREPPRPTSAASDKTTCTRSSIPNWRTAHRRKTTRPSLRSTSNQRQGVVTASTSPGSPPPVPRSTARAPSKTGRPGRFNSENLRNPHCEQVPQKPPMGSNTLRRPPYPECGRVSARRKPFH